MSAPDYAVNDPRGWCGDPRRGAAMGRPEIKGTPTGKLYLRRVRLDAGAYDRLGTYWGSGEPLYWCADISLNVDWVLRAADRDGAKATVRGVYPEAEFWR